MWRMENLWQRSRSWISSKLLRSNKIKLDFTLVNIMTYEHKANTCIPILHFWKSNRFFNLVEHNRTSYVLHYYNKLELT